MKELIWVSGLVKLLFMYSLIQAKHYSSAMYVFHLQTKYICKLTLLCQNIFLYKPFLLHSSNLDPETQWQHLQSSASVYRKNLHQKSEQYQKCITLNFLWQHFNSKSSFSVVCTKTSVLFLINATSLSSTCMQSPPDLYEKQPSMCIYQYNNIE